MDWKKVSPDTAWWFYNRFKQQVLAITVGRNHRQKITDAFHRLYYDMPSTWKQNTYLGYPIKQIPFDTWLYQELIYHTRPAFILQTGVDQGGSILYFAHLLDLMGASTDALVIGVDITLTPQARTLNHPRIRLLESSSTDPKTLAQIDEMVGTKAGMVSLDSDHSRDHVLRELELYHRFVAVGNYLVVEDTNVNGHPVRPLHGPGPFEAVEAFMSQNTDFERDDAAWQRNLLSAHQYGWLRRIK